METLNLELWGSSWKFYIWEAFKKKKIKSVDFFKPEKVRSNKWDCTSLGFVCKVNQCLLFYCNVRHYNTKSGLLMFATFLIIITNSFDNFLTISPTLTGDNASAWLDHDHVSWISPFLFCLSFTPLSLPSNTVYIWTLVGAAGSEIIQFGRKVFRPTFLSRS